MNMFPVIPPVRSPADLPATPAGGQSGFASAETEAQLFVDIFNNFLLSDSNTTSALSAPGASTNSLLLQLLNSQQASKTSNNGTSNGKPMVDSLDAIGIGFPATFDPDFNLNNRAVDPGYDQAGIRIQRRPERDAGGGVAGSAVDRAAFREVLQYFRA